MPRPRTITDRIESLPSGLRDCLEAIKAYTRALGEVEICDQYITRLVFTEHDRRFAHLEVRSDKILVFVGLNRSSVHDEPGFTRSGPFQSTYPAGEVEITIRQLGDVERAKRLLQRAYAKT